MTATNHVLTGAIIGLNINQPAIAIFVAFISHFILDALPHYGDNNHTHKRFIVVLFSDMLLASLVLAILIVAQPINWLLVVTCSIAAASPDLMWLPGWIRDLKKLPRRKLNFFMIIHKNIQWAEKSRHYPIEMAWSAVSILILVNNL